MAGDRRELVFRTIGVVGLVVLLAGAIWASSAVRRDTGSQAVPPAHDHAGPSQHGHDAGMVELDLHEGRELEPSGTIQDGLRVVDYEAFRYGFAPDPLVVVAGERVRLRLRSRDVAHGVGIPAVDLTAEVPPAQVNQVEFAAPAEPGEYPVFCTVYCGPQHGGMTGTMIVLPAHARDHHD